MDIDIFGVKIAPTLVTFVAGLSISLFTYIIKSIAAYYNFYRFQKMIYLEYVYSDNILERGKEEVKTTNKSYVEKIDYLIKNELSHLKYSNQYKYIRLAEFTNMYLKELLDIMEQYPFANIDSEDLKNEFIEIDAVQHYTKKLSKLYAERKKSYVNFRRDTFLTPQEKYRIRLDHSNMFYK